MDLVTGLRELWRRRAFVAGAVVVAVIAGLLMSYSVSGPTSIKSRQHQVALASTSALLDTPSSQVVDLGGKSSAEGTTLPGRAALLASLLTTSPLKDDIAHLAGIDPRTLLASTPGLGAGAPGGAAKAPLATGTTVRAGDPRASSISLQTDAQLPIIIVNAESRDANVAGRLANGTISVLRQHLAELAGNQKVPANRQVIVKPLGPARVGVVTRGAGPLIGVAVSVVVFLIACGLILLMSTMVREWRRASAMERAAALELSGDDEGAAEPELQDDRRQHAAVVELHEGNLRREGPVSRRG
jgi:hypothetical protein